MPRGISSKAKTKHNISSSSEGSLEGASPVTRATSLKMSEAERLSKAFDEKIEKIRKEFERKLKSDGNGKELADQLEEKLDLLKEWVKEEIAKISEVLQEKYNNSHAELIETQERFLRTTDDAS